MTLAEKIKVLRKNREWTQAILSEKVCLSEDAIQKWEAGVNTPPLKAIKQLADVFMIPAAALIDDEIDFPMYIMIDIVSPELLYNCYDLTDHAVFDADLKEGAHLHRYINKGGCPYSAIYIGTKELMTCERDNEQNMINYWNKKFSSFQY